MLYDKTYNKWSVKSHSVCIDKSECVIDIFSTNET
jgi:hypothetical protein